MLCNHFFFLELQHRHIKSKVSNGQLLAHSNNESFCDCCGSAQRPQNFVFLLLTGIEVLGHIHEVACQEL
jgi:hypothetical protein